jgi:AraC-like DNA-binding protein
LTIAVPLDAELAAEPTSAVLPPCLGNWRLRRAGGLAAPVRCVLRPLAGVAVGEVQAGTCSARRPGGMPGVLLLSYVIGGSAVASSGPSRRLLQAGDLSLWPGEQALSLHVAESLHLLALALPAQPGDERLVAPPGGLRIGRDDPLGQMLAGFFDGLSHSFGVLDERQGSLAIGMVRALLAQCLQRRQPESPAAVPPPMLARILAYTEARLGDPGLTPQRIADAHGISLRSLQVLFERKGLRVAEWIRDERLARCRDALAQPGWDGRIIDVALQWGFNNPSHFSRLFRQRFGRAPRQVRAQARHLPRSAT